MPLLLVPQKHLRCLGSRLLASAAEERDKASVVVDGRSMWTGLWMEQGGARDGSVDGAGEGREGRETEVAWVWTGLWMEGKGREMVWTGLGKEGRGARRKLQAHGCGRGCGWKERSARREGAWVWTGL